MKNKITVFSLSSSKKLAQDIASILGTKVGDCKVNHFADGEILCEIGESVRGKDVFIVQSTSNPVTENLMEILVLTDALKRASAREITAVIPYFGYARQDRKAKPRQPITSKLVADLLTTAGVNRVVTVDLHAAQIQGFFDIPVDEMQALPLLIKYFRKKKVQDLCVVSPDHGGATRARKIFLPKSVANMLVDWKAEQDEMKEILGDEYMDYNLVMASTVGLPLGDGAIRGPLKKLIEDYNLPPVVFHSFRHSSVTYKLKLNGGDIKAVQGDSGHAQVNMVTDVYSHILDDDRRKNAELFEEAFYEKKNLDPQMHVQQENSNATVADEVNPELLAKVLANPEMRALLNSLAKTMK